MSAITTHVLDLTLGRPAAGVRVQLFHVDGANHPTPIGEGRTDPDGRLRSLLAAGASLTPGTYRLSFDTAAYFATQRVTAFYPTVDITFTVTAADATYHVPLLLAPHGYSTYRGS